MSARSVAVGLNDWRGMSLPAMTAATATPALTRASAAAVATTCPPETPVPSQAVVLPGLSHFQAYSYAGFEVGSTLAADWFVKYLASPSTVPPSAHPVTTPAPAVAPTAPAAGAAGKDVRFFSEAVAIHGGLFYPPGFTTTGSAPAVVLAPGWGGTVAATERAAAQFAAKGIVALAIDYRGWGKSGGFIYGADITARIERGHRHHDRAAVTRAPDADAIRVDSRLALQERHGRTEVRDLVHVVEIGSFDDQPPLGTGAV